MARKINVKLIMELRDAGLSRSTIASQDTFQDILSVTSSTSLTERVSAIAISAPLRNRRSTASSIRKNSRTRPCTVILTTNTYIRS